ncbi:MAG: inorganic phosphate transporter [Gammaproteobacteria bacterium]
MNNTAANSEPSIASTDFGTSKLSLFFGTLLLAFSCYFFIWGMDYTGNRQVLLFALALGFGIFMAFNIGGNDVANAFGTSVGAGTLTIKQALCVAAIFEVSGAVIAGGEVTNTIRNGIVDLSRMAIEPMQFMQIMMAALLAAGCWLLIATRRGWPVSTTHSIVGGIVGSSIALGIVLQGSSLAFALVQWHEILGILISWVLSPLLGGIMSYALFFSIKKYILNYNDEAERQFKFIKEEKKQYKASHKQAFERLTEIQQIAYNQSMARDLQVIAEPDFDPSELESDYFKKLYALDKEKQKVHATRALEIWVPFLASLGAVMIVGMLLFIGLNHINTGLTTLAKFLITAMTGATAWMATFIFAKTLKDEALSRSTFLVFSWMQVFTASVFAFSHGSNDIANAVGPFAAILDTLRTNRIDSQAAVPTTVMATFGVALIAGLWFIGREVIETVGRRLTQMHPASGFSAELSTAAVVMFSSVLGLPVSSTHILIGAVLGIGLVNHHTNWRLMKPIAMAWIITLPAAGILSAAAFIALSQFNF